MVDDAGENCTGSLLIREQGTKKQDCKLSLRAQRGKRPQSYHCRSEAIVSLKSNQTKDFFIKYRRTIFAALKSI